MEQINNYVVKRRSAVAVGNFDCVHQGHKVVFKKTREIAATENLISVALTFTPHPRNFIDKTRPVKIITDDEYKQQLILSLGIEKVYFQSFNSEFAEMDCKQFVSYLKEKLLCSVIVCGEGFRCGKNASYGTIDLDVECRKQGMRLEVVPVNSRFSSSTVRSLIESGRVDEAAQILGRPYSFCSEVIGGKKLGKKIGFPTINQKFPSDSVIPKFGVYGGFVNIDGIQLKCIVNIGIRPTVNNDTDDVDAETFILGFNGDIYGRNIRVYLDYFVREERKFNYLTELSEQIKADCRFVFEKDF